MILIYLFKARVGEPEKENRKLLHGTFESLGDMHGAKE
jgi:hypothetical protein